jgi:hypothetical protein
VQTVLQCCEVCKPIALGPIRDRPGGMPGLYRITRR